MHSEKNKEMFFDSCLSYQFSLINAGTIPSVSLVARAHDAVLI
jgi:hypothetical protein